MDKKQCTLTKDKNGLLTVTNCGPKVTVTKEFLMQMIEAQNRLTMVEREIAFKGRYMLFMFNDHYAGGGFSDYVDSFDTIESAVDRIFKSPHRDNFEIIDKVTLKEVYHD